MLISSVPGRYFSVFSRYAVFIGLLVSMSMAPWPAVKASEPAPVPPADDLALEQVSVRELMRLETALALRQAQERHHARQHARLHPEQIRSSQPSSMASAVRKLGAPQLVAIYGVGQKLLAEVSIDRQSFVYMRGHATPVGVKPAAAPFHLKAISARCVELEQGAASHRLCLQPPGSGQG